MTSSHRNHPSSYPATPAGSRALAARLRNDHGIKEAVYRRLVEDHAAHSAMHAAAHENGAAMEVRIEQDAGNGRVLVTAASGVGEITYTMAGETAELVHVTPRGRVHLAGPPLPGHGHARPRGLHPGARVRVDAHR